MPCNIPIMSSLSTMFRLTALSAGAETRGNVPSFPRLSMDTTQYRPVGDSSRTSSPTFLSSNRSVSVMKPMDKLHVCVSCVTNCKRQVLHSLPYCRNNVTHHIRTTVQPDSCYATLVRTCILTRACALIPGYFSRHTISPYQQFCNHWEPYPC
jgi:hypothetical protein